MNNVLQINEHVFIDQNKLLGKGSTGNVYFGGSFRDPSAKFAVKAIDLSEINNEVTQYLLSCEIVALSELAKLNIESIVKLHEIAFHQGHCYLVMELLEGGSLAEYIRENPNGLNEKEVEQLFRQMFQGYKAIRDLGIVHRDIKPDNLIFRYKPSQNPHKKLCFIDFGYCTKDSVPNKPQVYYNVGSPKYMSPEAFKKNTYSEKSDMWALGIILYEMLHGRTIDRDMDMDEYMQFMEHSELPIERGVSFFLRNLLNGLLVFDVTKRITCKQIEQLLNERNHNIHGQQQSFTQFRPFIPRLEIPHQSFSKKLTPHRSEIMTHRSNPSQTSVDFYSNHNSQNLSFDPRRQQRNSSQENNLQQFNRSPKKIMHLEHTSFRQSGIAGNEPFPGDKKTLIENFKHFQQRNTNKQVFNGQRGSTRKQLEKIDEEQENAQSMLRNTLPVQSIRVQPDIKRSFLKSIQQRHFQPEVNGQQFQPRNPSVRFIKNPSFLIGSGTPSKPQDLARSQIFQISNTPDRAYNSGNNFFSSQINDKHQPNIRVITSDKAIDNRGLERLENDVLGKNLNKSFSTQNVVNVTQSLEIRTENQPELVNFRFVPLNLNQGQQLRPIDLLMQNKEISNNRAFLRNTMPNVYRSTIEQSHFGQNQQTNSHQNLENSINLKKPSMNVIDQVNHSNFKNHSPYFDQNFATPQKQSQIQNKLTSNFNKELHSFTTVQNKNEKSHSFKFIQHQVPRTIQRDMTQLNLLSQTPVPVNFINQKLQFNPPNFQMNHQNQPMNSAQQPLQVHEQQIKPINHQPQLVPMGQFSSKQVFFSNIQQKPPQPNQNQIQQPQHQMINLQQPVRQIESQFRRSTIVTINEPIDQQQQIHLNQQRNFSQNQNISFQQPRQTVIVDKPYFSQVLQQQQIQRPILVNTINQNPEINRMIRPTYPFMNQKPITVTHY